MVLRTTTDHYDPRLDTPDANTIALMYSFDERDTDDPDARIMVPHKYVVFDSTNPVLFLTSRKYMEENDFQLTYSFSDRVRVNAFPGGTYGEPITFRELYNKLCTVYNGERFIDRYFTDCFPYSPVGNDFKAFERNLKETLQNEYYERSMAAMERKTTLSGTPDLRTKEGRFLKDFDTWKLDALKKEVAQFNYAIKEEIIQMLSTGQIPLNHTNVQSTFDYRDRLGLDGVHEFYASGQLINDIKIDIRLKEDVFNAWA